MKTRVEVPFDPKTTHVNDVFNAVIAQTSSGSMRCHAGRRGQQKIGLSATEILPCRNGLLHLKTRKLLPHTAAFIGLNSLPYGYNSKAGAPRELLTFMGSIWPDDRESAELLQEWFGYILSGSTGLQKIMLLVGAPRGGKGVIARLLRSLIGAANTAGPTLGSLADAFGLEPLIGKQLATVSDGRLGKFTDGSAITEKLLSISGEDALSVPRKFKTAWHGRLSPRLMLLMNQAPGTERRCGGALARRFLVLSFSESFLGREDHGLEERLRPSCRRSSIGRWPGSTGSTGGGTSYSPPPASTCLRRSESWAVRSPRLWKSGASGGLKPKSGAQSFMRPTANGATKRRGADHWLRTLSEPS